MRTELEIQGYADNVKILKDSNDTNVDISNDEGSPLYTGEKESSRPLPSSSLSSKVALFENTAGGSSSSYLTFTLVVSSIVVVLIVITLFTRKGMKRNHVWFYNAQETETPSQINQQANHHRVEIDDLTILTDLGDLESEINN